MRANHIRQGSRLRSRVEQTRDLGLATNLGQQHQGTGRYVELEGNHGTDYHSCSWWLDCNVLSLGFCNCG